MKINKITIVRRTVRLTEVERLPLLWDEHGKLIRQTHTGQTKVATVRPDGKR